MAETVSVIVIREFLLLVLGFGDPTKGMTRIWGHFVILVGCELVTFKPQIKLKGRPKLDHFYMYYFKVVVSPHFHQSILVRQTSK